MRYNTIIILSLCYAFDNQLLFVLPPQVILCTPVYFSHHHGECHGNTVNTCIFLKWLPKFSYWAPADGNEVTCTAASNSSLAPFYSQYVYLV